MNRLELPTSLGPRSGNASRTTSLDDLDSNLQMSLDLKLEISQDLNLELTRGKNLAMMSLD